MSLLDICQTVATEAGFGSMSSIIGNNDEIAQLLLSLSNRTGQLLRWRAWQVLQKEATITTIAGTEYYPKPSDLLRIIQDTMWDRTNYWKMRGSLTPLEWQVYKSGLAQVTARKRFRLWNNLIYVFPIPEVDGDEFVYEYVSKYWVVDDIAAPSPQYRTHFQSDSDQSLINEELISLGVLYRFLERKGFAYQEAKDEFNRQLDVEFGVDTPKEILNMGAPRSDQYWPPLPLIPITGYS